MTQPIAAYLTQLRQLLATGAATEHTHRPALAVLLQTYPGVRAINEPTRIACGAPDFAVLKDGFIVGHIEAKDVGADLNAIERTPQLKRWLDAHGGVRPRKPDSLHCSVTERDLQDCKDNWALITGKP